MYGPRDDHSKKRESEKDKYMILLICGILKENDTKELISKWKQTHRHRKPTYGTKRERNGGGIYQEFGINRYTLIYIKQINNKDQLYSTEKYTSMLYNEKESEIKYR